jgi:hypothetical protein
MRYAEILIPKTTVSAPGFHPEKSTNPNIVPAIFIELTGVTQTPKKNQPLRIDGV